MSKKIIYLLSLLMALSLVFASCKKNNGVTDALGGLTPPPNTGAGEEFTGDNGLFGDYSQIPTETEIANVGVYVTTDGNYYRNPVLVAREDGAVFVFAEKRWRSAGSGNDVGIDGENTTDVIYKVSANGGYKFDTQENTVGTKASGPQDSHGAPVVFVNGNDIVIVATSGSGIGRTSQLAAAKPYQSKIEYIQGTIDGTKITWTSTWTEISEVKTSTSGNQKISEIISKVSAGGAGSKKFDQFGTQPSRGFVDSTGNMYLAVVLAQQGTSNDIYELMGRMTIKASISNPSTWEVVDEPVAYTDNTSLKLGPWKETKLISADSTGNTLQYLIVPSPWTEPASYRPGVLGTATKGNAANINKTAVKASEGSPGFFTTDKWYGSGAYTLKKGEDGKVTITSGSASKKSILVHVQQTASQLYLYRVNDSFTVEGNGWKLDDVGKSSSVDMLPDGTVVVATEKGGQEKNYFIRFLRYSQPYLEANTK